MGIHKKKKYYFLLSPLPIDQTSCSTFDEFFFSKNSAVDISCRLDLSHIRRHKYWKGICFCFWNLACEFLASFYFEKPIFCRNKNSSCLKKTILMTQKNLKYIQKLIFCVLNKNHAKDHRHLKMIIFISKFTKFPEMNYILH